MAQYQEGQIADGPNGPMVYRSATGWVPLSQQQPRAVTIGTPNRAKQERDAQQAANEAERIRLAQEAAARADRADARAAEADKRAREAAERGKYAAIPPAAANGLQENLAALRKINSAIAAINRRPQSIGIGTGMMGDAFTQLHDPDGTDTRAAVGEIGAQKIHDLSGAAVSASEAPRFKPFVPSVGDQPEVALQKLERFRDNLKAQINEGLNYYGPANGYRPYNTPEAKDFRSGGGGEPKADGNRVPLIPGSDTAAPMGIAQGQSYSTPQDLALAAAVQKAYRGGGTLQDLFNTAKAQGYTPSLQDAQAWQAAIDSRNKGNPAGVLPRKSGKREGALGVAGEIYGKAAAAPYTGAAISAGIGAGNAAAMGGLDELVGGIDRLAGGNYEAARDYADLGKQAVSAANPGSYLLGGLVGTVAPALAGGGIASRIPGLAPALTTTHGIAATGAGYGAVTGGLEDNQDRLGGALSGAVAGTAGGLLGAKVAAPLVERAMASPGGQALSESVRNLINRVRPNSVSASAAVPMMTPGERVLPRVDKLNGVVDNLQDAARLNLPYALGDAAPELRNLLGSASRISPQVRADAERIFDPRALGQADRARDAIDRYLAPITDIDQRGKELIKAGNTASDPYYTLARGQSAPSDPEVLALLQTPAGRDALTRAREIAQNNGRDPTELGFLMDDTGTVLLPGMEGRFAKAQAATENAMLAPETIRTFNGASVTKRAPLDLVGWLRTQGGVKDFGGELSHMGISNRMRPGVDMKGQENRFGPILNNESGLNLDEAARAAWEAGYFPEATARPDVNTFLNALREGHDGIRQRYRPEDQGIVDNFLAARGERQNLDRLKAESSGGVWNDTSQPAGQYDYETPPPEAYGQQEAKLPTFETLDLIKKGFDARLNEARDPFGNIDLQGNPQLQAIDSLRGRFVSSLDRINPNYPKARATYQKFAQRKDALTSGLDMFRNNLPQRTFDRELGKAASYDSGFVQDADRLLPEMQRGFATGMADKVGQARMTANPYNAVYGSTNQQQRVGQLFPEGAPNFNRTYNLESDMAKTAREVLGGSPTASRQQADASFMGSMPGEMVDQGVRLATGGGLSPSALVRAAGTAVGDRAKFGLTRKAAEEKANSIAGLLMNTDPNATINYMRDLMKRQADQAARDAFFKKSYGLFGATAVPALLAPSGQ